MFHNRIHNDLSSSDQIFPWPMSDFLFSKALYTVELSLCRLIAHKWLGFFLHHNRHHWVLYKMQRISRYRVHSSESRLSPVSLPTCALRIGQTPSPRGRPQRKTVVLVLEIDRRYQLISETLTWCKRRIPLPKNKRSFLMERERRVGTGCTLPKRSCVTVRFASLPS